MNLSHWNRIGFCVRSTTLILFGFIVFASLLASQISAQTETTEIIDSLVDTSAVVDLTTEMNPAPPPNPTAGDSPNDGGGSIRVTWQPSEDDRPEGKVKGYRILRADYDGSAGEFAEVGDVPAGKSSYAHEDGKDIDDDNQYVYKVVAYNSAYDASGDLMTFSSESGVSAPASSRAQWYDSRRTMVLFGTVLLVVFIMYFINRAKSGKPVFIRKIAGLEAIDEAVGRATEMGRKIFYIPGIGDMDNMMTIAAITILGRVSELSAQYETYIDVPVCRSMVMVTGREVVKEAYSKAGRPDAFQEDQVHYLTDDQFGYAAGVDGMFVREKPATIFFMGQFYAESLILAETGNSIGAIQIAGTAMPSQLPFFVAACDYTLIGEELFAASAYLSKEPKLLGSLKGQDIGKGVILVALIIGVLLETFGIVQVSGLFSVGD